jgi:membrane-bound ClpP family serine protease
MILIVLGIVCFLYGANFYNAVFGWAGIGLFIAGLMIYFAVNLSIYLEKKKAGT